MIFLDAKKDRRYVLRAERGQTEATVFGWRLMPARRYYELQATTTEMDQRPPPSDGTKAPPPAPVRVALNPGLIEMEILIECLRGVENLRGEDGEAIAYEPEWPRARREDWLTGLAPAVRRELAEAFSAAHELTEPDRRD